MRVQLAGAPAGANIFSPVTPSTRQAGGLTPADALEAPSAHARRASDTSAAAAASGALAPVLNDCNAYAGLKHYFLACYSVAGQEYLQNLISSDRLAFGSTPALMSMPCAACKLPPGTRNSRPTRYWRGHRQRRFSDLILESYRALDFHLSNYKLTSKGSLDNPMCGIV